MIGQVARDVGGKVGKHRDWLPASGVKIREGNGMAVRVRPLTNVNGVVGHAGVLAMVPTRLTRPNTSRGNRSFVPGQMYKSERTKLGVGSAGTIGPATNYGIVSVSPAPRHKEEWP